MAERKTEAKSAGMRKGTGPRTQLGKERSKRNSITHAIFSSLVVLKGESQSEFDALLNGLCKDCRPRGTLAKVLVDRLASLFWRLRRVSKAENAEIETLSGFVQWDEDERNRQDAARLSLVGGALMLWITNPDVLQRCLDLLNDLREVIDQDGFDPGFDTGILTQLFGPKEERQGNGEKTLFDSYSAWLNASQCSEEERKQNGYPSAQDCKNNFLGELDGEVRWLERYREQNNRVSARKLELQSLRHSVPEGPRMDLLLRYEAGISREINRTLNQLMQLGVALPAPINVSLTTSKD